MKRRDILKFGLAALGATAAEMPGVALAQNRYPARPIRMVVPFAPGGSTDIVARLLSQRLSVLLGAPILIDNRAGAGGSIGAAEVAHAKPDGYTLLFSASSTQIINPVAMENPTYDGIKDFIPIALAGLQPVAVAAGPAMPARTFQDLLAELRANPGKYSYATPGAGTINHLSGEMFRKLAGVDVVHVPYKGAAQTLQDVMAGHVALSMVTMGSVMNLYRAGKVRILATFTESRLASAPDVPTAVEAGLPGMLMSTFNGVFAPAQTPRPIVDRLFMEANKVVGDESYKAQMAKLGFEPSTAGSPEQIQQFIVSAAARLAPIVKSLGIRIE